MLSKNRAEISLKRTFLKRFFWGTLITWLIVSLFSYTSTRHEIDELYDGEMAQISRVLLGIYSSQPLDHIAETQITSSPFEGGENYERKLAFQIWNKEGKLLVRSANAPVEPLAGKPGKFQTRKLLGRKVRTLSIKGPEGRLSVHVGQNIDIRRENAAEILELLVYALLLVFPVLLWLINKGLNQGTQSLNALSEKIAKRTENDLSPIKIDDVPLEIRGIVDALNTLMSKMSVELGRERQFISDASHELRTPLAGIKAHAQLALKDKSHEHTALIRIVEGVDRTTRLANQLLTLSGVDAMDGLGKAVTVDIRKLIEKVVEDLHTESAEKSVRLITQFNTKKLLTGNEDLLYILLRNLIDNAIRYSPPSSEVKVSYQGGDQTLSISVADHGPGISADQHDRVFDRFYRDIDSEGSGSGLGLAIARQIASLHKAKIVLGSAESGKGLSVKVIFEA